MTELIPGFDFDKEGGQITFSGRTDVLSTYGVAYSEGFRGISFGHSAEGYLRIPEYGKEGSLSSSVLEYGGTTRVAAVASADLGSGLMRAGEGPEGRDGGVTVVIMIDAQLPQHSSARAMVTVTEAVTRVIRELNLGGKGRSTATGSALQDIIIATPHSNRLLLTGTGKHSKLGELIGRTAIGSITESARLNGHPDGMGSTLFRLGLSEDTEVDAACYPYLMALLQIRDEIRWGFLPEGEGNNAYDAVLSIILDMGVPDTVANILSDISKRRDTQ